MFPQPEKSSAAKVAPATAEEYSLEERALLLRLAHSSIEAVLAGSEVETSAPSTHLAEPRGAFTTLYLAGQLRGCVGYIAPLRPLFQTVAETAVAAAFHDVRFPPVVVHEAPHLKVSVSVLSLLSPIAAAEVVIGRHGLLISYGMRRGLLLPQVPIEHGWDVSTFLQQVCLKAGLPPDAWTHGATLEAFTAEVFGE